MYTSGDDNQIFEWNPESRECTSRSIVNTEARHAKKNKASTLSKMAESQCSRAVATSASGHMAVAGNDGSVTIRLLQEQNNVLFELRDASEWIEAAEYSADGSKLAVGSHDTNIYIYDTKNDYALLGKCTKHNATVTNIDWSLDGSYIRSVCNGYELLFFTMPDCNQDGSGASNTKGMEWASHHCKFGWSVDGIFPKETSGDHINAVDMSEDGSLIATGDDFGLV